MSGNSQEQMCCRCWSVCFDLFISLSLEISSSSSPPRLCEQLQLICPYWPLYMSGNKKTSWVKESQNTLTSTLLNNFKLERLEMSTKSALLWLKGQQPFQRLITWTGLVAKSFKMLRVKAKKSIKAIQPGCYSVQNSWITKKWVFTQGHLSNQPHFITVVL